MASDSKMRDWYDEKALRSRLSADTYARMLCLIAERLGMSPEEIVISAKKSPDKLRVQLTNCASALKKEGWLDTSVSKGFLMVKAYLKYRHANVDVFPHLSSTTGETIQKERPPTQGELAVVLDKLSLRGRVIALFMAHSGLRPQVLGFYQAENGLRLRDLPDLKLQDKATDFKEIPFVVRVPASLSKTRVSYTTFGTSQQSTALLAYLSERRNMGEKLDPDSPVVASHSTRGVARVKQTNAMFSNGFLTTSVLMRELREVLGSSLPDDVTWRPYVLRSYCSTRLLLAEGAGKMTRDLREAILGHDTGIAGKYNLGKPWGTEILKEARAQYKRAAPFLETNANPILSAEEIQREAAVILLTGLRGRTQEEARRMVEGKCGDELSNLLSSFGSLTTPEKGREEAVPVEDVPKLLKAGWGFVADLNGSMKILRSPGV
jgi:integrase